MIRFNWPSESHPHDRVTLHVWRETLANPGPHHVAGLCGGALQVICHVFSLRSCLQQLDLSRQSSTGVSSVAGIRHDAGHVTSSDRDLIHVSSTVTRASEMGL